ncbi:hypothetical protein JL722_4758 [Aureococcus anophagefferens]|nr:hypothetical protein JL722_4758 [Aureococcus anophagefferens]
MRDPVVLADGYSYERRAAEAWLAARDTSPATNRPLDHKLSCPNRDLADLIRGDPRVAAAAAGLRRLSAGAPAAAARVETGVVDWFGDQYGFVRRDGGGATSPCTARTCGATAPSRPATPSSSSSPGTAASAASRRATSARRAGAARGKATGVLDRAPRAAYGFIRRHGPQLADVFVHESALPRDARAGDALAFRVDARDGPRRRRRGAAPAAAVVGVVRVVVGVDGARRPPRGRVLVVMAPIGHRPPGAAPIGPPGAEAYRPVLDKQTSLARSVFARADSDRGEPPPEEASQIADDFARAQL